MLSVSGRSVRFLQVNARPERVGDGSEFEAKTPGFYTRVLASLSGVVFGKKSKIFATPFEPTVRFGSGRFGGFRHARRAACLSAASERFG